MNTDTISRENIQFWDDLCGSTLARSLNIKDNSPNSLKKFDDWYLNFYPYLLRYVHPESLKEKKVLEVGLGYGTLGQKIAQSAANYIGLDIAKGPVQMMNHRLKMLGLGETANQGSMLECPFESETFDQVVSIGCFHHTGNLQKCIDETHRVLKPGGKALLMVYNQYGASRFIKWPIHLSKFWLYEKGIMKHPPKISEKMKGYYDSNTSGKAAPETIFPSKAQLKTICHKFKKIALHTENSHSLPFFRNSKVLRKLLLNTVGRVAGTDIYFELTK